jgi:hypothetical protein
VTSLSGGDRGNDPINEIPQPSIRLMFWDVLNQRSFLEEDPGNSGRFDEMIREAFGYSWHRRSKADLRAGGQHDASAWNEARPLSSSIAI